MVKIQEFGRNYLGRWQKFQMVIGPIVFRRLGFSVFFGVLWFAIDLSFVVVIQVFLVGLGILDIKNTALPASVSNYPKLAVGALVLFGTLRSTIAAFKNYTSAMAGEDYVAYSRDRILRQALASRTPVSSTAEIMHVFSSVIGSSGNVVQGIIAISSIAVAGLFYTAAGFYMAPKEFTLGMLLFAVLILPLRLLEKAHRDLSNRVNVEVHKIFSTLVQSLRNIFLLRLYGQNIVEYQKCHRSIGLYRGHISTFLKLTAIKGALPLAIGTLVMAIVTWFAINVWHTSGMVLISLFYIFLRVAQSAGDIMGAINQSKFYFPYFKQMYHTLNRPEDDFMAKNLGHAQINIETISAINLGFEYSKGQKVLENINLNLKKGDILLIRGESGAGKSTLVLLLTAALKPSFGKILLNGLESQDLEGALNSSIGHVGPDPFVIPGSVRENMMYANPNADLSDAEIWSALQQSRAFDFINQLPEKLNTFLNEETQLSTGQKQRLSLARALLRSPLLLILDEATANLDSETESEIIEFVKKDSARRITFIISHKNTFDRIATHKLELSRQGIRNDFNL